MVTLMMIQMVVITMILSTIIMTMIMYNNQMGGVVGDGAGWM